MCEGLAVDDKACLTRPRPMKGRCVEYLRHALPPLSGIMHAIGQEVGCVSPCRVRAHKGVLTWIYNAHCPRQRTNLIA